MTYLIAGITRLQIVKLSRSSETTVIPIDAPIVLEVRKALRKLENGRAAGPDSSHSHWASVEDTQARVSQNGEKKSLSLYKGEGSRTFCRI